MAQPNENQPDFASIFASPTIDRMLTEVSDLQFEHFVKYVFEQAGYGVEHAGTQFGHGLDLRLFQGPAVTGTLYAGVSVKHFSGDGQVTGPQVAGFQGYLGHISNVPGYVVTTTGFNRPALVAAEQSPRVWPIDGEHLVRYINYVRGTRHGFSAGAARQAVPHSSVVEPIPPEALLEADAIQRRDSEVHILTVANHKGGVGKTTTALNLAFGLSSQGKQVLLVDMDAQANLTRALAYPTAIHAQPNYLDDYFEGACSLAQLVSPTKFPPIWLIPSRPSLIQSDRGLTAGPRAELQFARDLHAANVAPPAAINAKPFDWIIIDTGPWMGFFTRSALAASRYVIVPISPSVFADIGLELLMETVGTMQALTGTPLDVMGCLVTQWSDNALNKSLLQKALEALALARIPRMQTEIPLDKTNIERAHLETAQGRSRNLFDRRCAAARAYTHVVDEVLHYVQ